MPVKTVTTSSGRAFKLGRHHMVVPHPRLKLRNYLRKSLPPPPATVDYSAKAMTGLREILMNDQLGDCVPAWMCHATSIFTGNAGDLAVASNAEVEEIYHQVAGFNPADPTNTDNGTDENLALSWWQNRGITVGGKLHQIAGSLAVDAADEEEQRTAIWLFENLMYGVGLPDAWIQNPPDRDGWVWDVAGPADPSNGHCFGAVGYAANYSISTWGMLGAITPKATATYCVESAGGQLFVVWTDESVDRASQRAPNGFAWSQLLADAQALQ